MKKVLSIIVTVAIIASISIMQVSASSTVGTWYEYYLGSESGSNSTYCTMSLVGADDYRVAVTSRVGATYSTSVKIGSSTQKVYGAGSYRMYHNCSSATNAQITLNRTVNGASCSVRGKITY